MIVFGPVPSRRLGYSLGINHIPPKHCTYSCIYCQVGRTSKLTTERQEFYSVKNILAEVQENLENCKQHKRAIDYITLVPDGEPTLDKNLGVLIKELKQFQIPIAVISNASLLYRVEVQNDLLSADWVSVKIDSVSDTSWRKIARPHPSLSLSAILNGIYQFRKRFQGEIVTETMLVEGINDSEEIMIALTDYLLELQPFKSYLSIPIRPPAETRVKPPGADTLALLLSIFDKRIPFGALLFDTEGSDFISTGNIKDDICSITAVHPLFDDALRTIILRAGENWSIVDDLVADGTIVPLKYRGEIFYCRKHSRKNRG